MNTQKNQEKSPAEMLPALYGKRATPAGSGLSSPGTPPTPTFVHPAEIITPQPYGIYALCKIMEHFQIN